MPDKKTDRSPERDSAPKRTGINTGPGRTLAALYALFALAATGRSLEQLIAHASKAPLAYSLSALAAVVYIVATVCLVMGDRARTAAIASCSFELVGVIVVGILSYVATDLFPDKTVWSHFGSGYGYLPLLLPILGLTWLFYARPGREHI
ncbi:MAG: hypothetical protein QM774_09535 [Gordonia sp. (in: high G+C Gram-positive bacteria)]|uniref:hypothetical protein n=1 Tax=Gordonia sp. (in: high G+C Gram-positive bacteria) TaxID=84139 RepID=UPI0039E2678D